MYPFEFSFWDHQLTALFPNRDTSFAIIQHGCELVLSRDLESNVRVARQGAGFGQDSYPPDSASLTLSSTIASFERKTPNTDAARTTAVNLDGVADRSKGSVQRRSLDSASKTSDYLREPLLIA